MNTDNILKHLSALNLREGLADRLMGFRRILAVSPHPDDMEFAAGGFLCLAARSGSSVHLIVVSDGRKGTLEKENEDRLKETRRKEQLDSASILGIPEVDFLECKDSEIPEPRILRSPMMKRFRSFRPDLVVSLDPYLPYEAHLDHVNVGKAVLESVLLHSHPGVGEGKPVSHRPAVLLAATANPNVIVNIDGAYDLKMKALNAHASQMDSTGYIVEEVKSLLRIYGSLIGAKHGEPFRFLEGNDLHMNPFSML